MAEINPLAVTRDRRFVALDAALSVDDDALFRQSGLLRPRARSREAFEREQEFRRRGWTYLPLDGDIGILSSGAGITMVILDLMRRDGGRPANFLDTAQMRRQDMYDAFQIFYPDPKIKTVLVHIFAGLNRCDDLAEGIRDFLKEFTPHFKIVVRMIGNREEAGRAILETIGIETYASLEESVRRAIAVTEEQP
jgi:succinyl-CoA synthetase beta subunit